MSKKQNMSGPGVGESTARAAAIEKETRMDGTNDAPPAMRSPPGPITAVIAEKIRARNAKGGRDTS